MHKTDGWIRPKQIQGLRWESTGVNESQGSSSSPSEAWEVLGWLAWDGGARRVEPLGTMRVSTRIGSSSSSSIVRSIVEVECMYDGAAGAATLGCTSGSLPPVMQVRPNALAPVPRGG